MNNNLGKIRFISESFFSTLFSKYRPYGLSIVFSVEEVSDLVLWSKPESTGWWQVKDRNILTFDERPQNVIIGKYIIAGELI